jgi:hypothetical protein
MDGGGNGVKTLRALSKSDEYFIPHSRGFNSIF